MLSDWKEAGLEWLDTHGVNTSKDFLKLNILWAVVTLMSAFLRDVPTISALDFYKVTAFMLAIAYILYAGAKPKQA